MPLSALSILGELPELFDCLRAGFAGWRYLLSPSFRAQTHARWQRQSRWRCVWDVLCAILGFAFTTALVALLLYFIIAAFAGSGWLHRLFAALF